MAGLTGFVERLTALHVEALEQEAALDGLAKALVLGAEQLHRRDQVRCLSTLRATVQEKVRSLQDGEAEAHLRFSEGRLLDGAFKFAIGGLTAALRQTSEHPLSAATRQAKKALSQSAPFGGVVVAIGPGGVPDDVAVVSLSKRARESWRMEAEEEEALRRNGSVVLTPRIFIKRLDLLTQEVLQGVIALPIPADRLRGPGASAQS